MDVPQINTSPRTYQSVRGMVLIKGMMVIRSPLTFVLQLSLQTYRNPLAMDIFTGPEEINLEEPQKSHQPVVIAFTFSTP